MSHHPQPASPSSGPPTGSFGPKVTVPRFMAAKAKGEKLAVATAYDYLMARAFDESGVDSILVGDSLGMVVQGHSSTLPVTIEQMIYHGEIVARACQRALVIVDLPFMSYQVGGDQAVANAGRILKETGAAAVKLEGGALQAATIRRIADADIPVMAHVGLRPQAIHKLGGLGKIQRNAEVILADAKAAEEAGAFGIVLELIPADVAALVTKELRIPTIGIGAGPHCDGQVLVGPDLLGITPGFSPKFLKRFAEIDGQIRSAAADYVNEVHRGTFPGPEHTHS